MSKTIVAYVPVLHRGYLDFFRKYGEGNTLLIPHESITSKIDYLWRDMRALSWEEISAVVGSLGIFQEIKLAGIDDVIEAARYGPIIMPEEDISFEIQKLLPENTEIIFDQSFLRWNRFNVLRQEDDFWDKEIDEADFFPEIVKAAFAEGRKSSDWWRQVGAVAFKNGEILLAAHNRHLPTELEPYFSGDPRTVFEAGKFIEFSNAVHAEAGLIAEAARRGLTLKGAEMFVTTFPCPPCANQILCLGLKRLYVGGGYSNLDAKRNFAEQGIEIVKIKRPSS